MEASKQLIRFYTITSELGNMVYVGSTEKKLERRYGGHKSPNNSTMSKSLFTKYGSDNCKISEILNKFCDKHERDTIEAKFIQQ